MKPAPIVAPIILRAPYNYDTDLVSDVTALRCLDPSRADQSQRDASDINNIVRQFGVTGELPINKRVPLPEGHYDALDYREALNAINATNAAFDSLPSSIRSLHDNDPEKFLAWVDQAAPEELAKLFPGDKPGAVTAAPKAPEPVTEPTGAV